MSTYNGINDAYYAKRNEEREQRRKEREQRERDRAAKAQAKERGKAKAASPPPPPPATAPLPVASSSSSSPGPDDKDGNYVVRQGEVLAGRYVVEHSLGKGSFGRVLQCHDRAEGRSVAIKIVKAKRAFYKQAQVELRVLQSLQADAERYNIVQLLDSFMHVSHQCIVFELLSINLYDLIRNTRFTGVTLILCAKFAYQLLHTLNYLTSPQRGALRVIHCDLKPENILLRSKQRSLIKLIDFGSSCHVSEKAYTYIQSRFYRAPEVLLGAAYDAAIDMWSLGCLLMELHTGHPLFDGTDEKEQIIRHCEVLGPPPFDLVDGNLKALQFFDTDPLHRTAQLKPRYQTRKHSSLRQELGSKYRNTDDYRLFLDLVAQMLRYNPHDRVKPAEAMQHPFFELLQGGKGGAGASSSSSSAAASPEVVASTAPVGKVPPLASAAMGEGGMVDVQQPSSMRESHQQSIPIFSSSSSSASSSMSSTFRTAASSSSIPRTATWSSVVSAGPHPHPAPPDSVMMDADKENTAFPPPSSSSSSFPVPPLDRSLSDLHTRPNVHPPLPTSSSQDELSPPSPPSPPTHPPPTTKPLILPSTSQRRRRRNPPHTLSDSRTARTALVMSLRSRTRGPPLLPSQSAAAPRPINTSNRFAALQSSPSHASQEEGEGEGEGSNDSMEEGGLVMSPGSSLSLRSRSVQRSRSLQRGGVGGGKGGGRGGEESGDLHVLMTDDAVSESPTSGGVALCVDGRGSGSPKGKKEGRRRTGGGGKVVRVGSKSASSSQRQSPADEVRPQRRIGRSRSAKRDATGPQADYRTPSPMSALERRPSGGGAFTGVQTRSASHKSVLPAQATAMEDTEPTPSAAAVDAPPPYRSTRSRPFPSTFPSPSSSTSVSSSSSSFPKAKASAAPSAALPLPSHLHSPRVSHFSNAPPPNGARPAVSFRRPMTRQAAAAHHSQSHSMEGPSGGSGAAAATAGAAAAGGGGVGGEVDGSISQRTRSHITLR